MEQAVYKNVRYNSIEEQVSFLEKKLKGVEASDKLSETQRQEILKFASSCMASELSHKRVGKYITSLEMFASILKKPFKDADRCDLENLWKEILLRKKPDTNERYSPETLRDFKIAIKKYYKIAEGNSEVYPEKVRFIKCTKTKDSQQDTLPELLKPEHIEGLLEKSENLMWKAYIAVSWETGMRLGEIVTLRIKDVTIEDSSIRIRCKGKTGSREFPFLVECYNSLVNWIHHHPYRDDPDSLLVN